MAEIIYPISERDQNKNLIRTKIYDIFNYMLTNNLIYLESQLVIFLERNSWLIYSIESCIRLGITYIPIDTAYPNERIAYILQDLRVADTVIITNSRFRDRFANYSVLALEDFDEICKQPIPTHIPDTITNCHDIISMDKMAYIIYTSGTSGMPKGVMIPRKSVWNLVECEVEVIEFGERMVMLCSASVSFDIFFAETILPLLHDTKVVLLNDKEQHNIALFTRAIVDHEVNMIQLTPSRLRILYEYDPELTCLKGMKSIIIGGEDLPKQLLDVLKSKTDSKIYNAYGPTETGICVSIADLTESDNITIGKPIRNVNITLCDTSLMPVNIGQQGEICIEGLSVGAGYLNNDELTRRCFVRTALGTIIYKTGDIGEYQLDGSIKYIRRKDCQVKLNGYRIELEEIESIVRSMHLVNEAIARVSKSNDSIELFYTTSCNSNETLIRETLKNILKKKLPHYMIPAKYIQLNRFNYTINGKIDRNNL